MTDNLKARISEDTKTAMRARDKARVGVMRMVNASIKQVEIDERIELEDDRVLAVLEKMIKQRREAHEHYVQARRTDLAQQEAYEIELIETYLPEALPEQEIDALIADAIGSSGAQTMKDMGKVMGALKTQLKGRADMRAVSEKVKQRLS